MTMLAKMVVRRGMTTYVFESEDLEELEAAERWVFASPERLSKLDEAEKLYQAQPGDTIRLRTR